MNAMLKLSSTAVPQTMLGRPTLFVTRQFHSVLNKTVPLWIQYRNPMSNLSLRAVSDKTVPLRIQYMNLISKLSMLDSDEFRYQEMYLVSCIFKKMLLQ